MKSAAVPPRSESTKPLGQQLPDDASPAAADRQPEGDLGPPRAASCEQHVGEIQTGDDEDGYREQHEDGGARPCTGVASRRWAHRRAGSRATTICVRPPVAAVGHAAASGSRRRMAMSVGDAVTQQGGQHERLHLAIVRYASEQAGEDATERRSAAPNGNHTSAAISGSTPVKPSGATPTTVNGRLLMRRRLPTSAGSKPCRRQNG
jgi:hypothetical protein